MTHQNLCVAREFPWSDGGRRFTQRYEACRQALSIRAHAPVRLALAPAAGAAAASASGRRAGERSASLLSPAVDPAGQSRSHPMLMRQALGGMP
ncbi:MAG: hypothetical protein KGM46_04690 [Pseudomonadota bacterium]|jgi:hypothetical protein|nr:hypothetical protein [Xanthomonadaceae bacterium]MDE2249308.1 hypothetical protein [Xanthomonadaceae bacterium]MDE3210017.1 hypothetical protein [Pseudomonadota bacterium]